MMDLNTYLKERIARIDQAIDREMPADNMPPADLHRGMRYCLFPGGKRIRPVLLLASAEACGGSVDPALRPAVAVEVFHAYTLVHDDLPCMDDDDIRRGKPSCHKAFGEAAAVLIGDALQALAFEILARTEPRPPATSGRLVSELADAAGSRGVVGGQVEDVALEAQPAAVTADQIAFVHQHKTADLFRVSTRLGALTAGASPDALAALTRYGNNVGLAFQIVDDLLDAAPGQEPEKATCVTVYGVDGARRRAADLTQDAIAALAGLYPAGAVPLEALARMAGSRAH